MITKNSSKNVFIIILNAAYSKSDTREPAYIRYHLYKNTRARVCGIHYRRYFIFFFNKQTFSYFQ